LVASGSGGTVLLDEVGLVGAGHHRDAGTPGPMKIESYVFLFRRLLLRPRPGSSTWLAQATQDAGSTMLLGTFLLGSVPGFYYSGGHGDVPEPGG